MRTVTAREANQSFSKLLWCVERGETVLITKHGKPVAEISPKYANKREDPKWRAAHARLIAGLASMPRDGFRVGEITEEDLYEDALSWPK